VCSRAIFPVPFLSRLLLTDPGLSHIPMAGYRLDGYVRTKAARPVVNPSVHLQWPDLLETDPSGIAGSVYYSVDQRD